MSELRKMRRRLYQFQVCNVAASWLVCWIDSKERNRKRRFAEWERPHAWQFYHIIARAGYACAIYEWMDAADTWVGRAEWSPETCNAFSSNVTRPEVELVKTFRP